MSLCYTFIWKNKLLWLVLSELAGLLRFNSLLNEARNVPFCATKPVKTNKSGYSIFRN